MTTTATTCTRHGEPLFASRAAAQQEIVARSARSVLSGGQPLELEPHRCRRGGGASGRWHVRRAGLAQPDRRAVLMRELKGLAEWVQANPAPGTPTQRCQHHAGCEALAPVRIQHTDPLHGDLVVQHRCHRHAMDWVRWVVRDLSQTDSPWLDVEVQAVSR